MRLLLAAALLATRVAHASAWWRDEATATRGAPSYPYPGTRDGGRTAPRYNTKNEKDGPVEGKINVHLVPHTHDDTGWQVTVDQYFFTEVYYVVDTVVDQLVKDPKRHFIYVETGFFARWWDEQPDARRNLTRSLVASGQLEFINGAWCMHDEASPFYVEMVDQTTRGHQFLKKNFGEHAIPRGTWQIDPFGHSNTEAWLLGAEAGFESLYWGRTDYQDLNFRMSPEGKAKNQFPEWVWQGSQSLGPSAEIFAGQLTNHGYGAPMKWDTTGGAIQDNPSRHDYNLDQVLDAFVTSALSLQNDDNVGRLGHQLWPCGSDFQYQNADHWYHNLDKLIHYINYNASQGGPVVAFYSTPSHYTDMKHAATKKAMVSWEVRQDDVFPLANEDHAYWSGYFTSRPGLKRQVRFASNFLNAGRQMEVISGVTAAEVNRPTTRPSPPVGDSWTDSLEGAIGVATHHDGMSGTERQDVSNDYSQRISEGHFEVEAGVAKSLQKLTGLTHELGHCNCNAAGNCLNMSMCAYTTGVEEFTVLAWNPLGQASISWLRIPVSGGDGWTVTDLSSKAAVASQAIVLDARTKQLPILYLNKALIGKSAPRTWKLANNTRCHKQLWSQKTTHAATNKALSIAACEALCDADNGCGAWSVEPPGSANMRCFGYPQRTPALAGCTGGPDASGWTSGWASSANALPAEIRAAEAKLANNASHTLTFAAPLPPLGYASFRVKRGKHSGADVTAEEPKQTQAGPTEVSNGMYSVKVGASSIESITNLASRVTTALNISFGYYVSSEGGCTNLPNGTSSCSSQASGAYLFRPQQQHTFVPVDPESAAGRQPTISVTTQGPLVTEVKQSFANWATYVLRLTKGSPYIEIEWTAGPIPWDQGIAADPEGTSKGTRGKELVLKLSSGLQSGGRFFADSNGREMILRERNKRGPSYPPYEVNEPVAGNYYPVNSLISLDDGDVEMAVVTDVTMGGSSMADGQLELMVHRRCQHDDHRGVQEPLNETMCGCNDINAAPHSMGAHGHEGDGGCDCQGLTMRGSALLVVDKIANAHKTRRSLIEQLNFPPTLAFSQAVAASPTPAKQSFLGAALPPNIKLMTVSSNYRRWNEGQSILRLSHLYQTGEHPTLSAPVTLQLAQIFSQQGLQLKSATETMLTANQGRAAFNARKKTWATVDLTGGKMRQRASGPAQEEVQEPFSDSGNMTVTIRAMEVKTFLVTFA